MIRKASRVGRISTAVSLPADWVKINAIKPGDELEIEIKQNDVIVRPIKQHTKKETEIITKGKEVFLKRYIKLAYKQGFDSIHIKFDDPKVVDIVKSKLQRIMGFEISKQTKDSITIESILSEDQEAFDVIFRRLFYLTEEMAFESVIGLQGAKTELKDMEIRANKLACLLERLLNTKNYHSHIPVTMLTSTVVFLEMICDDLVSIGSSKGSNISEFHKEVNTHLKEIHSIYFAFNKIKIEKIKQNRIKLIKKGYELLNSNDSKTVSLLISIMEKLHHLELLIMPVE